MELAVKILCTDVHSTTATFTYMYVGMVMQHVTDVHVVMLHFSFAHIVIQWHHLLFVHFLSQYISNPSFR